MQVKNIIYHAVKDALNSLKHYEREQNSTKGRMESDAVLWTQLMFCFVT